MNATQRRNAAVFGGVIALAVGLGLGADALYGATHDDPPQSEDQTASEIVQDMMDKIDERMRNAGYDSYYRRLAEVYDLPRSEMDDALFYAPMICDQYYMGNTEAAANVARNMVVRWPSDYTRDIKSGRMENALGWSAEDLIDMDAQSWAFNTAADYCPSIGYGR